MCLCRSSPGAVGACCVGRESSRCVNINSSRVSTGWGGFAERVALRHADLTLAALPEEIDFVTAASLGCRFATSFRAVQAQGKVTAGDWVAIHGCGGVGLAGREHCPGLWGRKWSPSTFGRKLWTWPATWVPSRLSMQRTSPDVVTEIQDLTGGGAHVSLRCVGASRHVLQLRGLLEATGKACAGRVDDRGSQPPTCTNGSGDRVGA